MTNRFTENARRVLSDAARTAGELGHAHIGSEQILLAITLDGESTAMRVLKGAGITSDGVRRRIIALLGMGESCVLTADDMTPLCKKLLLDSSVCSRSQRYGFIGSEHLLMAILREDCNGRRIIETEGADVKKLYASLERMFSDDASYGAASPEMRRADRRRSAPTVERNAVDLTARAEDDASNRSSGARRNWTALSVSCCGKQRIIPCSSARRAWERPLLSKGWRRASCRGACRRTCRASVFIR